MIRGKRVSLRPVEEDDIPLIHRWMNQPEVWHYMDYDRAWSAADVREDLARSRQEGFPLTILVDGRPIGRIGLNGLRARDRICSMYMYIGEPEFWGQGFARDAVFALLGYAFDRQDLNMVELWALGDNDRALRTYAAAGFVREARLRDRSFRDGRWVDHVIMSVTREEFTQARKSWESAEAEARATADGAPSPSEP